MTVEEFGREISNGVSRTCERTPWSQEREASAAMMERGVKEHDGKTGSAKIFAEFGGGFGGWLDRGGWGIDGRRTLWGVDGGFRDGACWGA